MPECSDRYPDRTLEKACVAAGARVICAWQIKAPKDTNIAWLEGLIIGSGFVIVQTLKGGGWQALSATPSNRTDATVADVLARCGVKPAEPVLTWEVRGECRDLLVNGAKRATVGPSARYGFDVWIDQKLSSANVDSIERGKALAEHALRAAMKAEGR